MGRPALAFGGIALIGVGIAVGVGWWSPSVTELERQVTQQIRTVRIDVNSGDVGIQTGPAGATTVHQRLHRNWRAESGDAFRVDGDELVLSGCGRNCTADFQVTVPPGTAITGGSTSGDIKIRDTGPVDVSTTSGDIDVAFRNPQDIRAQATSGDVRVVVPPDRYRVTGRSTTGDRQIDVATDPSAPHVLDLSTTSGDVTAHSG